MTEPLNSDSSAPSTPSASSSTTPGHSFRPSRSQSLTSSSSPSNPEISLFPSDSTHSPSTSSAGPSGAPETLIRRHHTLSTSSSRLIRGERNKARLALQGAGLSEADQKYYLPDSPVTAVGGGNWPEMRSNGLFDSTSSSKASTGGGTALSTMLEGASSRSGAASPALSVQSSNGTQGSQTSSAFVVVRASKGDAPLSERKAPTRPALPNSTTSDSTKRRHPVVTPPRHTPLSVSLPAHASFGGPHGGRTASPTPMESWNSSREAGGNFEGDADWQQSVFDEKVREAEDTIHQHVGHHASHG